MRSVSPVLFVSWLGLAACAPAGSSAFVAANVPLNGDCAAGDGTSGIGTGLYDVLSDNTRKTECLRPYQMNLFINGNLVANRNTAVGRAETNALLVRYADVRLMDKNEATLAFRDKDNNEDASRPNPYRIYTAAAILPSTGDDPAVGNVPIEAIPVVYGESLRRSYAGDNILVEVQLFGKTTSDVEVEFAPFLFPLAICKDCASVCSNDPKYTPEKLIELNADSCGDNRPQDDRICVADCT
jgi:hypothetical protein